MLKIKIIVQNMAVLKPHTVEVTNGIPLRFHIFLRRTADNLEALVKCIVSRHSVACTAANVVTLLPELLFELSACVLFDEPAYQKTAIARRNPFDRSIKTCVEHKSVFHIVGEHSVVKHTRLTKHRPLLYVAVENVSLTLDFACRILVVRARYKRIPHSPPGVLVIAVAVYRNSGNMHEFGLIFLYLGH